MIDSNKKITHKIFFAHSALIRFSNRISVQNTQGEPDCRPEWEYSKASFTNASVPHHVLEIAAL